MKRSLLGTLILLLFASGLPAEGQSLAMKTYVSMKQDTDLYVGEGIAELKDFDGSAPKALEAAHQRAQASLAEAVSVQVSSETSENMKSDNGKVSEKIESQTKSKAAVVLDNVKFLEFKDFPDKGQVTVLASLSKADYRRQLAGKKVSVYRPEDGLQLSAQGFGPEGLAKIQGPNAGSAIHTLGGSLEFLYKSIDFELGMAVAGARVPFSTYSAATGSSPQSTGFTVWHTGIGYDWVPWDWRLQPFVPLRVEYVIWDLPPFLAQSADASAGLGLRYWVNGTTAFSLGLGYHENLMGGDLYQGSQAVQSSPGHNINLSSSGVEYKLGIMWSDF